MAKGNRKWVMVLLVAAAVLVWANPLQADALNEQRKAQNKLLAQRAARVDAIRKLAERIRGLAITSETTVRDFVTESDTITTQMMGFLSGAREVGKPKYMEDGTCEVTLEITIKEVVGQLKKLYSEHYKGDTISIKDIENISVKTEKKVLRETGMGAPRPELEEDVAVEITTSSFDSMTYLTGEAKAYWLAHVKPQGRLMAVRAARVDALRRLGERIAGVFITSDTTVRDFVAESDAIDTNMTAFIRGARESSILYHSDELIVEVEMEVTLREVITQLKSFYSENYSRRGGKKRIDIKDIENIAVKTKDKVLSETGMGVPPEKYLKNVTSIETTSVTMVDAPSWVTETMTAVGQGAIDDVNDNPAQAKLMAFRAAELDARRKLAEQLEGLMITSETSVRDFVTEDDEIRTSMLTFQQGAHVVDGSQKVMDDGSVEVTVEIELAPLWESIRYYQRTQSITIR